MPHWIRNVGSFSGLIVLAACGGGGGGPAALPPTVQFGTPDQVATGGADGRATVAADVDHDGVLDFAIANAALANVSLLRGRADGTFAAPAFVAAPSLVAGIALADTNGDRSLDLIAWSATAASLTVSPGNGDGTFAAGVAVAVPWPVAEVVATDWDLDGRTDLLVASATVAQIQLLRGIPAGFQLADTKALPFVPSRMVVGDFDGNSVLDVAAVGRGATSIAVLRNSLAGTFLPALTTATTVTGGVVASCDLDGDRAPELVVLDGDLQSVSVYRLASAGTFAKGATVGMGTASVDSLALGDFDGDGKVDVAAAAGDTVRVAYGDGAGAFGGAEVAWRGGGAVRALVARDRLGRGLVDLLCVSNGDKLAVLRNPRGAIAGLRSFGTGTWDCAGRIGMWANGSPTIGNADFAYLTTNAPPDTFGIFLQGGPADEPGSDPLAIGALLHISTSYLVSRLVFSDHLGSCVVRDPMPTDPGFVGLPVHVQTMWFANRALACTASMADIASSRGMTVTIRP